MSDSVAGKGSCLCGAVKIHAKVMKPEAGVCHCSMCRKWGGALMAVNCGTEVEIEGEDQISVFNSSMWAERGFCKNCGSHLFYRLKGSGQYIVPVGHFDDQSPFTLSHQVFIDEKPAFYAYSNKTEDMTGAEIFAKFAGCD